MKKDIFQFHEYKSCLKWLLEDSRGLEKGQRSRLAGFIHCQPAYLSRVLNDDAHLSFEQGEAAARFFTLGKVESQYFLALLGEERAGTQELKAYWRGLKEKALSDRLELSRRIDVEMSLTEENKVVYFSAWYYAAIHAAVSIKELQTVEALMKHLGLSQTLVRKALTFLCSVGVTKKEKDRYVLANTRLHLDKNSPLVGKHHLNWKLKSMEAINQPKATDLHYTSVITLSRSDIDKVREAMFAAIEQIRGTVSASKDETLACYNFDFFELNRT